MSKKMRCEPTYWTSMCIPILREALPTARGLLSSIYSLHPTTKELDRACERLFHDALEKNDINRGSIGLREQLWPDIRERTVKYMVDLLERDLLQDPLDLAVAAARVEERAGRTHGVTTEPQPPEWTWDENLVLTRHRVLTVIPKLWSEAREEAMEEAWPDVYAQLLKRYPQFTTKDLDTAKANLNEDDVIWMWCIAGGRVSSELEKELKFLGYWPK